MTAWCFLRYCIQGSFYSLSIVNCLAINMEVSTLTLRFLSWGGVFRCSSVLIHQIKIHKFLRHLNTILIILLTPMHTSNKVCKDSLISSHFSLYFILLTIILSDGRQNLTVTLIFIL